MRTHRNLSLSFGDCSKVQVAVTKKHFFAILILLGFLQNANGDECPTTNARGENCISATPSVETDGDWVTYKESLTNSCDCTCDADFKAIGGVVEADIVVPHGKGEVICLNVRGKGCRGFEKSFRFTCRREGNDSSSPTRTRGPNSTAPAPSDQTCADYKNTCVSGCSQQYPITSENYHNCMSFCSSPCSNGTLREHNPYLKSDSTNSNQGRMFSKDECRDERCASAAYETTESWQLTHAAKAICDQQYLQCLKDGQAKPDFDEALRVARTQVPAETPPPPTQQQQPAALMTADGRHVIRCIRGYYGRDQLICLTVEPSTETLDHTSVNGLEASVTGNEAIYGNVIRPFDEARPYP